MRRLFCTMGVAYGLVVVAASWPARADVLDYLWGHSGPPTLADVAKMIDHIQRSLVNQGTVVIKQPDVWSQARMTQFRQEYEDTMAAELTKFDAKLAGRIARADALAFASQTAVAGSISPLAKDVRLELADTDAVVAERDRAVALLNTTGDGSITAGAFPTLTPAANFNFLGSVAPVTKSGESNTLTGMKFGLEPNVELDQRSDYITHLHRLRRINLGDDTADSAGYGFYLMRVPLSIQPGAHTKKGFGAIVNLTISHDFNPRFLQSTYRNLVINDLIDKLAPVVHELIRSGAAANYEFLDLQNHQSKQPQTQSQSQSQSQTSPAPVDGQLSPEDIELGVRAIAKRTGETPFMVNRDGMRMNAIAPSDLASVFRTKNLLVLAGEAQRALGVLTASGEEVAAQAILPSLQQALKQNQQTLKQNQRALGQKTAEATEAKKQYNVAQKEKADASRDMEAAKKAWREAVSKESALRLPQAQRRLPEGWLIPLDQHAIMEQFDLDSDHDRAVRARDKAVKAKDDAERAVEKAEDEAKKAEAQARKTEEEARQAKREAKKAEEAFNKMVEEFNRETKPFRNRVRLIDVRAYLRNELEAAYDLVDGHSRRELAVLQEVDYIESLVDDFYGRRLNDPNEDASNAPPLVDSYYENFLKKLPGDLKPPGDLRERGLGALAWGIVLEAGLLNRHLQEDMKQTKGANDYAAPPDIDTMCFYAPEPPPEIERAFEDYVRARWPMITFALEPVTDQQNIEDAFTRSRDLQIAVAFALASGRISFRQAMQFRRILQYEAQTISLNQTVAAFANGNDTFGWRITPRYQTPPEESNFQALTNTIFRGGPGPNWQLANSKIEPGMRELTVMVVMPSFVRGVRVDSSGDWFRLSDPEHRKLWAARAVEIGRRINEARDALELACKHANYRPEDVERLRVRLRQLETMLPLQTAHVRVPYENTLGGFALFSQGKTDLVPQLVGFDGLDYIDPDKPTDLIIHGRNFSLYETSVIVGGKNLAREGTRSYVVWDKEGKPHTLSSVTNPIRDADGNLVLQVLGTDNTPQPIKVPDPGSYLIQSREVMRVRVPKGVAKVKRADGTEAVEINVSTPTGVSNRLLIPVRPEAPPQAPPPTVIARAASATILDPIITVRYAASATAADTVAPGARLGVSSGTSVRIFPKDLDHLSGQADVNFIFPMAGDTTKSTVFNTIRISDVKLENGSYVLHESKLNELARRVEQMAKGGKIDVKPGQSFQTSEVTVLIPDSDPSKKPHALTTTNPLTINYEFVIVQALGTASATTTAARAPAPRDNRTLKASDERIVIPPPARPLNLDALPDLPPSQSWDTNADDEAEEPLEEAAEFFAPQAQRERLAPRVAFQEEPGPPPPAAEVSPGGAEPGPTTTDNNRPTTVVIPPPVVPQTVVVAPQAPSVNVSVPITNVAKPAHRGLFRRDREPATPQNPARRSLLQRAINGP